MNGRACETTWFSALLLPERVWLPLSFPWTHKSFPFQERPGAALNSTKIQTPVGLKSWTPQTLRCCTYLPQLHIALIAAAFSSPQTQQPHGKEQEKCPVCPRIYSRVLLGYLYFIDPSRRKDRAFPLQSLSSFPTFFLFFFKGSWMPLLKA